MPVEIKKYLPKSLFGRSILIIVTPLILLQVVSGIIFFETHWDKVTLRLARGVAGDIAAVINLMRRQPGQENRKWIARVAADDMQLVVTFREKAILPADGLKAEGLMAENLSRALRDHLAKPFRIDIGGLSRHVIVDVQLPGGVLHIVTTRKRLFSSTAYVFVIWMAGLALILFSVATVFMRNQVKPIRRLAYAADDFGKGRKVENFKLEGAIEVRQAATAFMAMRDRIDRQIQQRTEMLAGVSHDLRTPLTRMKLQLEMTVVDGVDDLKADVAEMEHMLGGYLAFARGEGDEQTVMTNLSALLEQAALQLRRKGGKIDLHTEGELSLPLRPLAFRRAITNLIDNAVRYADHLSVRAGHRCDRVEIIVDDDGPGIGEDQREEVFKPFYRVEGSRNRVTGGVGLGLTICRDVIRSHGGEISLGVSPSGGLRVQVMLPL